MKPRTLRCCVMVRKARSIGRIGPLRSLHGHAAGFAATGKCTTDGWAKDPIDAFVLARMKKEGLHSSPEADKHTLIRRVTLDLTGLLPTPAELKTFDNDRSPQAYEHLVDGLLAKPHMRSAGALLDGLRALSDTYGCITTTAATSGLIAIM